MNKSGVPEYIYVNCIYCGLGYWIPITYLWLYCYICIKCLREDENMTTGYSSTTISHYSHLKDTKPNGVKSDEQW